MLNKNFRDAVSYIEYKVYPSNGVDHRFRLIECTYEPEQIVLAAHVLASNGGHYTVNCKFDVSSKTINDWQMIDPSGQPFEVKGLVSKTLYVFVHGSISNIIQSLGYQVKE